MEAVSRVTSTAQRRDVASFGWQLRRFRERSGLTQEELAERAGLSAQGISALERGLRRHPHPPTVRALAAALGLADDERAALFACGSNTPPALDLFGATAGRLPVPLAPIVGRERAEAEIVALLGRSSVRLQIGRAHV